MATPIAFNKRGVFGLETIDAVFENNTLTYVFEAHPYINSPYNGLLLIHFTKPAPTGTTATTPIFFETRGISGSRKAVTKAGGQPLVAEDITVPEYDLFFYDFNKGIVEAISAVI